MTAAILVPLGNPDSLSSLILRPKASGRKDDSQTLSLRPQTLRLKGEGSLVPSPFTQGDQSGGVR